MREKRVKNSNIEEHHPIIYPPLLDSTGVLGPLAVTHPTPAAT